MHLPFRIAVAAGAAIVMSAAGVVPVSGQTTDVSERFNAVAVRLVNLRHTESAVLEMVVTRWFSDDECDMWFRLLLERGPDALLDELREASPVGYVRTAVGTYGVRLAQSIRGSDGGRRVVLAIDQPIGLWKGANEPQSSDAFTLIDLRLSLEGDGDGEALIATKLLDHEEAEWHGRQRYELEVVPLVVVSSSVRF